MKTSGSTYLRLNCAVATLGGLLFGYDTAVIAGTTEFLQKKFHLSELQLGWAVSSAIVGCVLGAAVSGWSSDRFGRKAVLVGSAIFFATSAIGAALPYNLAELAFFRLLGGIGVGAASIVTPLYIAELAPARIRGALISFNQIMILIGMIIVYIVNALIARQGTPEWNVDIGWRWMFGSETLPALLFLGLLFFTPESPRWLIKAGRPEAARAILERIGGKEGATAQMDEIMATLAVQNGGWSNLRRFRRVLGIGAILAFFQHATGINVVMYYGPRIFARAGMPINTAIGDSVIIAAVMVVFTVLALMLVDRVGRRILLLCSTLGMALSLFLLGAAFKENATAAQGAWLLGCVLAYVSFFSVGMGPVVWVVIAEIFPNAERGRFASIAVFCMWTASLLISQFFPWQLSLMHGGVFGFYGTLCLLALAFIWLFLPETKNRSLEQIEHFWHNQHRTQGVTFP